MTDEVRDEALWEELQELRKQLKFYKEYDLLTGLYNKDTFYQMTRKLIRRFPDKRFEIFCVDIEQFKMVNDLCGSDKGDELLKYLAGQLLKTFAGADSVMGRIAADVYAVCLPAWIPEEELEAKILEIFKAYHSDIRIVPAVGVYPVEDKSLAIELMCDRAMLALNTVKGNYMKHLAVYDSRLRNDLIEEHEILSRADQALENGEFVIYMQPKCNMETGRIVGSEALVRWNHPQRGIVGPGMFIPAFEKSGFIRKLDVCIWDKTAAWISERTKKGLKVLPVSVNVSRIDILTMDVEAVFASIIRRYEIDPKYLEVEVTESAYTSRPDKIIETIEGLMQNGFTVLMDDFGSGYSSLNLLKDINIDMLKLDMRFLDKTNRKSRDILESVVHMAKWLKLRVIAEGVESQNQEEFLLEIGCKYAQGFYYYKPMPLTDYEKLLDNSEIVEPEIPHRWEDTDLNVINFKDLFHADVMTEQLANHILGAIALYEYDGDRMNMIRCNEEYRRVVWQGRFRSGENSFDVMHNIREEDRLSLRNALTEARNGGDRGSEVYVRNNGSPEDTQWFLMRLFYLSTVNGRCIFYASVNDVTDQMQAMEALRLSEHSFRIAMEASSNTLFELDIASRTAVYAQHSRDAFGLNDCVANAPEGFIEQGSVCPGYEEPFRNVYNEIYKGAGRASCVIQARMGDGSTVWNRITLIAIRNKAGKSVKAVGLVENVTKEIELEQKLNAKI